MKSKVFLPSAVLALSFGAIACGDSGDDTPSGLDCGTCGTNQVCDTTTGRCVGCRTSSDCHAPTAICRPADHTCVECLNNDQCPGDQTCNLGVCESAQEDECGPGKPCADGDCVEGRCIPVTQCTPADAATTCPGSECLADGTCLNSKKTLCTQSGAPLHASYIDEMVNVAWTAENGWTAPAKCQWTCDGGYVPSADGNSCVTAPECDGPSDCAPDGVCEGGACLGSRQKECDSSGVPAHATARQEQVTVTWTPGIGWSKPAACKWDCDGTYVPTSDGKGCEEAPECTKNSDCVPDGECYNKSCLGSKKVSCDSSATPDHAKPTVVEVTITWTAGSGWTRAEKCAWTCDKGYEPDGKGGCKETVVVTECTPGTCTGNVYCTAQKKEQDCGNGTCVPNQGCQAAPPACTPGTCTGNVFCTESKEELNCGDDHCVPGKGCSACTTDQHCLDSEGAGYYCNASNQCAEVTCTGCKATYETCDTTTHDSQGKGQCVPATCSSNKCSGDYACLSGHYSLCQYGCANNACKSAPVGCAAATDPDEYCLNQAEAQGNNNLECDVSTGSCVECLTDANCGSNSGKECKNHVCTSKCGNGKLDSGEVCDPALASSGWAQYYRSCEDMSGGYQTGNIYCEADCKNVNADDCHLATCRNNKADSGEDCDPTVDKSEWKYPTCKAYDDSFMGTIACTSQCTIDDSGCELDPCSDVPDLELGCGVEERFNQACNYYFDDSKVSENIVCTSHPTCAGKRVIDTEATLEKCYPEVQKVAVNWCSTQSDNNVYEFSLDSSNPSHTFYARVNVAGETGTGGTHSSKLQGKLLLYTSDLDLVATVPATRNAGYSNGANDEWMATVTTASVPKSDIYYYVWAFTGDDGESWYGCKNECDGNNCAIEGGNIDTGNFVMIEKSTASYMEDFANMTNKSTCVKEDGTIIGQADYSNTDNFTGRDGLAWSYKGFACAPYYTQNVNSKGVGLGQKSQNNFITASGFTGGIGTMTVTYKFANDKNSDTIHLYVNGSSTESASVQLKGSAQNATTGFGTATMTVNSATATSFTIKPTYASSNKTFVITKVEWTGV